MKPARPVQRQAPDPARRTAYDVVLAVDSDGAFANLMLPRLLRERNLDGRDAAFATELAYGTLRWQGVIDPVIDTGSRRPVDEMDPPVRAVLRLGAYQLLHLRVPPHAAVHATVDLARDVAGPRAVGFVNAVLRRVGEHDWPGWVDRLAPADGLGRAAFEHGYPRWIAEAFHDALGASAADPAEVVRAMAEDRPVTHLVARPDRTTRDQLLAEAGPGASAGPWSPYAVRLPGGDPALLPSIRHGNASVQDEGSQLAALVVAGGPLDGADARWLDMCAGPGGKSALLAGLLDSPGRLLASDIHPHRARLVAAAVRGSRTDVVIGDGIRPPWRPATFDRVLLDAPCTGLGALRRRPEVRWRRQATDVAPLAVLQEKLLLSAVDATRPGGLVGYVTCSPHPAETRAVVERAIRQRPGLTWIDAREQLTGMPGLGQGPDVQLWPHRHGTDAMYVALLRSALTPSRTDL